MAYAIAGAIAGFGTWRGDWLELLTLALAIVTGLWAAAAARYATTARLRRPLIAFSLLAPITLVPEVFQPVQELTALRLLTAATIFDALSTASSPEGDTHALRRWLWPALTYGGSVILAIRQVPVDAVSAAWGISCLAIVVATSVHRLLRPRDLNQEASSLHILWTLATAVVMAIVIASLARGLQDLAWAVSIAAVAQGLSLLTAHLSRDETSFSAKASLAPTLVAGLLGVNAYIALLNVAHPGPSAAAAAVIFAALLARPMTELARELLEAIPPRSNVTLKAAIDDVVANIDAADDVEGLLTAMGPLRSALPRGGIALACFEEDWLLVLDDDWVERREPGPGEALRKLLARPFHVCPVVARHVIDRSVRETGLRPSAELVQELDTDLIIPVAGGAEDALVGALFVGRPPRGGRLRGRRGALLLRLAGILGPKIKSKMSLELAGRRIADLEAANNMAEDKLERLEYQLERMSEENRLLRADRAGTTPAEVVGRSDAMQSLLLEIERAGPQRSSLLIRGEAGTGRTLVARTLHENSAQREGPLVQFHCAATPQSSHLEALVGRADRDVARPGLIELADKGTLLLEEVGVLSLDAQSELIKLLASNEVSRGQNGAGGPASRQVDVRVVGTTGRVTEGALAHDTLLPELHDRLKTLELRVPPLRERTGDIPELALFFIKKASRRHGLTIEGVQPEVFEVLERYSWPGNVRQLRAVIEHSALVAQDRHRRSRGGTRQSYKSAVKIIVEDIPSLGSQPNILQQPNRASDEGETAKVGQERHVLDRTFEEIEREALLHALDRANGNKAEAARSLGLKRTTFNSRLQKHLLDKE